jgi:hypothetical protein
MTLHIACDVCRRPYQIDESRLGSTLTCKDCSVPFEVCRENVVDPDAPQADDPCGELPPSEWAQVWACTVNGVGAVGVILSLVGMALLLFLDPRATTGRAASIVGDNARLDRPSPAFPQSARPSLRPAIAAAPGHATPVNHDAVPMPVAPLVPDTAAVPPHAGDAPAGADAAIDYDGPGSIPSSGRTVDRSTPLEAGQVVQVREGRRWYAADVLRVNDNGTVRIHYRGWSDKWDEDVTRDRVQLAHED